MAEDLSNVATFEEKTDYLKKMLPKYVDKITERDPVKRQFYKCPFPECKEREHTNSAGGAFSVAADREHWKCFSCNRSGDIFDLIGYQYGYIDARTGKPTGPENFKKQFAKACEVLGLPEDFVPPTATGSAADDFKEDPAPAEPAADPAPVAAASAPGRFKDYITACNAACIEGSRGYEYFTGRGLDAGIIQRCLLGYDAEKDLVIFPYDHSFNYYCSRSVDGKIYKKPPTETAGAEPVYNTAALFYDKPCFVCEGPIDAISIIAAGGNAVSIGGTGSEKLLKVLQERRPQHCLILCFDLDEPGRNGQKDCIAKLEDAGIDYIEAFFSLDNYGDGMKDPNDLLKADPAQLRRDIEEIYRAAKDHELETGSGLYSVGEYESLFRKHQTVTKQRISTGFLSLDQALYGGFANELYILSAETSIGKSAIASCLAQNVAAGGTDVLYYALEMGRDEFIARGTSMISKEIGERPIPYAEILNYKWDPNLQDFYRTPYKTYEPYVNEYMKRYGKHLYIIEGGFYGKTALDIANTAEEFKKKHGVEQLVIVVDYLQRLKADPNDRAQRDAMSITSAAVQILGNLASQKHNTVIAISSISNAQKGQRVTDEAGKYSGDIGYTGGILLGWNWDGYTNTRKEEDKEATAKLCKERGYREMILEVLKQRSGERDKKLTVYYYPPYNYFEAPSAALGKKARPHK